jgi:hypothetical protein
MAGGGLFDEFTMMGYKPSAAPGSTAGSAYAKMDPAAGAAFVGSADTGSLNAGAGGGYVAPDASAPSEGPLVSL